MTINIFVPKETAIDEARVAVTPETVKKLSDLGALVTVQTGAGVGASISDTDYKKSGATISSVPTDIKKADIVLCVQSASVTLKSLKKNAYLIGIANNFKNSDFAKSAASAGINAFAMDMVPRITRAQSMDVLSSQSNLAGYKAVLDACEHYGRAFPMMMTAAGTIPPAKVFVMGAGVAGLQAIATAKRLGAVVTATDVRPAAKEQVESLGGKFIAVEDEEFKNAETAGGYAKQMSAAYQKKQAKLVADHIAKQDIVITTALIPGRDAPKLIDDQMVKSMNTGSVIVDLAVENGGNCVGAQCGKVITKHGVSIVGHNNVPSRLAADTSALYARNMFNLLKTIIKDGALNVDWDDEIIKGIALTKDGKVIHPALDTKATTKPKSTAKKTVAKTKPVTKKKPAVKKTATNTTQKKIPAKKSTTKKTAIKKTAIKKKTTTTKKKAKS